MFKPLRVAHAGGGINNLTYTNSYEALNENLKKGFVYFELDFVFTKDSQLICLHDWHRSFERTFGFKTNTRVTLKEFKRLVDTKSEFTKCTLDGLAQWMRENLTACIVTDIKEYNIEALKLIYKTLPDANKRVIPQIYNPNNFYTVKEIGFDQIIWTLYRYPGSNEKVLSWVEKFQGPIAITMPKDRATTALPKDLKRKSIPTYVHTINTVQERDNFIFNSGITEIYTDFLAP